MKLVAAVVITVLALGRPAAAETRRGQVVCAVCWFEADRSKVAYGSKADLECAARCAKSDIPSALAVAEGSATTLYVLEGEKAPGAEGKPWLEYTGKTAEVEGTVVEKAGKKHLTPSRFRLIEAAPAAVAAPAAPAGPHELVLKDLTGQEQKLSSRRGHAVVLNFWATWCAPCRQEMPALAAIQARYAPLGLEVIGAAADGDAPRVLAFAREMKLSFPLWLGANSSDLARFGLGEALPGTVILDREGKVVWKKTGMVHEKELTEQLDRLLAPAKSEAPAGSAPKRAARASSVPS